MAKVGVTKFNVIAVAPQLLWDSHADSGAIFTGMAVCVFTMACFVGVCRFFVVVFAWITTFSGVAYCY